MFLFFDFLHSKVLDNNGHKEKAERAIQYTHQTSDAWAGVCTCNGTYEMDKTAVIS